MTTLNDHGHLSYAVTGADGAVTWRAPREGCAEPIALHYPHPVAGSPEAFPCDLVPGGCFPDFYHRGGAELGEAWQNAGQDDAVIWPVLEDWYRGLAPSQRAEVG